MAALLGLLLPDRGVALDPAKDTLQYNCLTWNRQNGLPANGITSITQTKDGYLWLGTQIGMVRFDGIRFELFNLPEGPQFRTGLISSLSNSRDDGLWFGIFNGSFGFFNGEGKFSSPDDAGWVDPGMNVIALREMSDGSLWVGTDKGVARYVKGDPNATIFDDHLPGVGVLVEDSQKRVWLGTAQQGLYYWQAGKRTPFPDDSLKQELITGVGVDRQGQLWVGTPAGVRCYDAAFRRKEIPPFTERVRSLLVDREGVVWIGTVGDGLACYKDGAFSFFRRSEGLAHNLVTSLFEDREGSLWIGTQEGLSQLTDVKFPIYSAAEGLPGGMCHGVSVSANGGLWIATSNGVSLFDGKKATNYSTEEGLSNSYIKRAFEARNGDVYLINGRMGIDVLVQGKVVATFSNQGWPTAMAEDRQGVVVSVSDRLYRISRDGMSPYVFKDGQAPAVTWIRDLLTSHDGALWVATVKGILRVQDGAVQQWSTATGLANNDVHVLCEDGDDAIWAGLTTGLARIKGGQVRNINRRDGLWDDFIFAIVPDDQGNFWINSSRGIFRVSRRDLNDFADGKTSRVESVGYNGMNAVKTIDTAEVEYMGGKTSDGRIWFPSPLGAVAISPALVPANQMAPLVRIESVRANGNNLAGHDRQLVPPGAGELEVHFTALSFVAPEKVRFRYRLEGYDQNWVEAEDRRLAFYTNLRPGRYTFRVTAANADGVWSKSGDALEIELRPHFYQTAWFYSLCGGLALCALAGIYLWRVRHLMRKEKALQENRILLEAEIRNRTAELQSENTERKRAEAALRVSEGFLNSLVENLPVHIFRKDREGRFTFANQLFCQRYGRPLSEIVGKTSFDLLLAAEAKAQQEVDRRIMETGQGHESTEEQTGPDGQKSFLHLIKVPVFDGSGQCVGVQGMLLDITARQRAEAKLAETSSLLETLLKNSPDSIYFKDRASRFVRVSNAMPRRFNLTDPEMMLGKTDADFFSAEHAQPALADEQEIIRTGQPIVGKLEKETYPDRRVSWALTTKMPWRDNQGNIIGTFGISKDITDLKETEVKLEQMHRQLLETSRQAGMAEVATNVLHNVGNVLNSVNVSAVLAADQVRQTKAGNIAKLAALFDQHKTDLAEFLTKDARGQTIPTYLGKLAEALAAEQKSLIAELEQLCKNVEHIKDIVTMQQSYAQTSGVIETFSLPDLIEDALRIHAGSLARHSVGIHRDYQARPVVTTDKHKVMQILINLVSNAKYACDESGHNGKQITVRLTSDSRRTQIAVIDNGVGIPAENLTRIFHHGFTTRKAGHGFGLHTGALAAKELGGSLTVQSDGIGHGATFTLELPNKSATTTQENPSAEKISAS
ncbi:MAG TPA: PAS domain-containing protein [Opitutaceae bacterium]|nr:PAS domain-containing protein [Opitutaceae bacterium]